MVVRPTADLLVLNLATAVGSVSHPEAWPAQPVPVPQSSTVVYVKKSA